MKPLFAIAALLLLFLPAAAAQGPPAKETVTVIQTADGLSVIDVSERTASAGQPYTGSLQFWAQQGAAAVKVTITVGGSPYPLADSAVTRGAGQSGFEPFTADLRSARNVSNGERYDVKIEYVLGGMQFSFKPYYDPASFVLFVTPLEGYNVESPSLQLTPAGSQYHAVQDVAANGTYGVSFVAKPHAGATNVDQTKWLWVAGAFVVGFLVANFAVRRGWMAAPVKSSKFQKGGAMESRSMLEGRKRTLLAAMKDLEQAHEAKQVPDDVYGPLKEEYKAQAVRVMRTLEEKKDPNDQS